MAKKELNHLISREVINFIVDRRAKKLFPFSPICLTRYPSP